jgi:aspartyl protease family protein
MQNDRQPPEDQNKPVDPATQKMGKNMMMIAWVIALVLLTYVFGAWEDKQTNPNQSPTSHVAKGVTEVSLLRNRYGHYVTNGSINQQPVTFLVDTGATTVAVPGGLQQSLGLISGSAHYTQTANGTTKAYSTTIYSLRIGDIQLFNVRASIVPNMEGEEILLGMSVLKQIEFSQKGNELLLRQHH